MRKNYKDSLLTQKICPNEEIRFVILHGVVIIQSIILLYFMVLFLLVLILVHYKDVAFSEAIIRVFLFKYPVNLTFIIIFILGSYLVKNCPLKKTRRGKYD